MKEAPCMTFRPTCDCGDAWKMPGREVRLHLDTHDTASDAWKRLLDLVDKTAAKQLEEFAPGRSLTPADWHSIVTLPSSIAKLKSVKRLMLYGSSLVRMPPEIGEMSSLEEFVPYTSYRLHWYPYEITRCGKLARSTVSTRALYGNNKHRSPFPDLRDEDNALALDMTHPGTCSVCDCPFAGRRAYVRWISLMVATDVLPLLVYACSRECLATLPSPPANYVGKPHRGGRSLEQPPRR
jgi:hypothetical protein